MSVFAWSFATSLNRRSRAVSAHLCDVFILLRRVAADADRADDFAIDDDGNSALQWGGSNQCKCRHPAVLNLILKYLAGPSKDRGCARFRDSHVDTGYLRIVQPLEHQQIATVIDDCDHYRRAAFLCFGFSGRGDFPGCVQCEHLLDGQLSPGCACCSHYEQQRERKILNVSHDNPLSSRLCSI